MELAQNRINLSSNSILDVPFLYDAESKPKRNIMCLHKEESCFSVECEKMIECTDVNFSTHCYAITREIHDPNEMNWEKRNETSSIEAINGKSSGARVRVVMAGCWSGGLECDPPVLIDRKHRVKPHNHDK
jgi:hypothetical protein